MGDLCIRLNRPMDYMDDSFVTDGLDVIISMAREFFETGWVKGMVDLNELHDAESPDERD